MNICIVPWPTPFWELHEAEVRHSSASAYYCQLEMKNVASMAYETTDYQVSADQYATVLRVSSHRLIA